MGKLLAVASGKGGVGKSTVAVGIGHALSQMSQSVLIVDLDRGLGCVDHLLNISSNTVFNFDDLITGVCDIKSALRAVESCPNLYIITAPVSDSFYTNISLIKAAFNILCRYFDWVILDCPASIGRGFDLAANCADSAIVVATNDIVSMKAAFKVGQILKEKISDVKLLVNKFNAYSVKYSQMPNIDYMIDYTLLQLVGVIPHEIKIVINNSQGVITDIGPSYDAFVRVSNRLLNKYTPLPNFKTLGVGT